MDLRTERRTATPVALLAAAALAVALVAGCGDGGEQTASATGTSAVGGAPQPTCTEEALRTAIAASGSVAEDLEYEVAHLSCHEGYGWAVIDPVPEGDDAANVLLRVTDTGLEVLALGTSLCTADSGIPAEVAALVAPADQDPAGDCPAPAPSEPGPGPADPGEPVPGEADFTG